MGAKTKGSMPHKLLPEQLVYLAKVTRRTHFSKGQKSIDKSPMHSSRLEWSRESLFLVTDLGITVSGIGRRHFCAKDHCFHSACQSVIRFSAKGRGLMHSHRITG